MAENLKTLRRRIRSIKAIQQVTRAMEMVSAAKLRKASQILHSARPYSGKLQEILGHLASAPEAQEHPLFAVPPAGLPSLVVVVTSDRGLCGSYNANIIRAAEVFLRRREGARFDLYCVGRKTADAFRRSGATIAGSLTDLGGKVEKNASRKLSGELTELYRSKPYQAVYLIYARFVSNVMNRPVIEKFLPLDSASLWAGAGASEQKKASPGAHAASPSSSSSASASSSSSSTSPSSSFASPSSPLSPASAANFLLEPNPAAIFNLLLPQYLRAKIHIVLAESFTSEHSARMMAMNNATGNCNELSGALTLRLNKARQTSITKEMLEIVSGAEALKG